MHSELLTPTQVFLALVAASALTAIFIRFIKVPYSVALVIVGLAVTYFEIVPNVHITPELVLVIFLPGLLFEASWNANLKVLRENWLPIGLMATLGVLLCTLFVGGVLTLAGGLDWKLSLVFGAMVAATDPVSVVAMFRALGVPKRLTMLLEGESLLNDGTAVVVFRIVAAMVAAGTSFSAADTIVSFGTVIAGGLIIGLAGGFVFSWLTRQFDDHTLEITFTVLAAYGTYLFSEHFHVSGVIAVVTTAMIMGNYGKRTGMSPTTRLAVGSFWEYLAFLVNSVLFIMVGSTIELGGLIEDWQLIAVAIAAVIAARAVAVYGLSLVAGFKESIPLKWQHVLFWGGLRGALSMALALSLPLTFPHRLELIHMTFGVVLFSLIFQGLTIEALIKKLKIRKVDPSQTRYQELKAQLMAVTVQTALVEQMRRTSQISERTFDTLQGRLKLEHDEHERALAELKQETPALADFEVAQTERELLTVKKEYLDSLFKQGYLNSEQIAKLTLEVDRRLEG